MMQPANALIAEIEGQARRFETACGSGTMVWRLWGQGASRRPIVLFHGGSGSWTHWIKQIPVFAERYEVWAPDLPGLGDSAMPDEPLTPETCGRVVAEGMVELFEPDRYPHIVAFSFGAHVGAFAAAMLGDRIRSLTLSGAAALGLPHGRVEFDKEHSRMTTGERATVHRSNLAKLMIANPSRIDDLAIACQARNVARARFRSRPFAPTDEIKRVLPLVSAPLAAIWGEKDQIAIPDVESRFTVLRSLRPEIITRLILDAGHWAMYEQPAAFNAALADVLAHFDGHTIS